MSIGTALVVIVAILAFAAIKIVGYNTRDRRHRAAQPPPAASSADNREIEELRERIKVLERIATDGNTLDATETQRIAAEIEALREKQN